MAGLPKLKKIIVAHRAPWLVPQAGLRTNALVCVGAALFVSLTTLMGDHDSPTRIASYIVSGVGFLAGGVILIGTLTVLLLHIGLRLLSRAIDARVLLTFNVEMSYQLRVLCDEKHESVIRTILMRHVNTHPGMTLQGIATQNAADPDKAAVVAVNSLDLNSWTGGA